MLSIRRHPRIGGDLVPIPAGDSRPPFKPGAGFRGNDAVVGFRTRPGIKAAGRVWHDPLADSALPAMRDRRPRVGRIGYRGRIAGSSCGAAGKKRLSTAVGFALPRSGEDLRSVDLICEVPAYPTVGWHPPYSLLRAKAWMTACL